MELNYRYAIVSFCSDLIDPNASSLPVALLMIATSGEDMMAAATGWYPQDSGDPISSALLKDMPRFLKAHVDELVNETPDVDSESILCALQHSLRNSVHVSAVSPSMTEHVDAEAPENLTATVTQKAVALFFKEMRNAGLYLQPKTALGGKATRRDIPPVPPFSLWPLPRSGSRSRFAEEATA